MRKKILISITSQFGYHTDTYMYCKYLDKNKYEVHYVGFDGGQVKREMDNVKVHYIQVHINKILRYWVYLKTINKLIRKENFDILFLVDCQGSLLIRLCNLFRKTILDIRTGEVWLQKKTFSKYNFIVWFTSLFFNHISIISISLAKILHLPSEKNHWLPLGGDEVEFPNKTFETLNLFYIGVLDGRNVIQTVEGVSIFKEKNPNIEINYEIVGYGSPDIEKQLCDSIEYFKLANIVTFHGRKNHDEINDILQKSNVGVVYIPITYGFTCQPTTKLYECLLGGMSVIATNTFENKRDLKDEAGVLIDDNPIAFANGLEILWERRELYNSDVIKALYNHSTWRNIVRNNLEPYLDKIMGN